MMPNIYCSECGVKQVENTKYLAVFQEDGESIRIEAGCSHITPNLTNAIAILGGQDCARKWFDIWMKQLECDH
jgi:hypothetical protein